MSILITNDDGFKSSGITELFKSLSQDHTAYMVAPKSNCSGMSAAVSLRKEIVVKAIEDKIFVVDGTPADCSYLGLYGLIKDPIDQIVSGMNLGPNLGTDVFYSGTIGAAIAGIGLTFPPVAFSVCAYNPKDINFLAYKALEILRVIRSDKIPNTYLININFPDVTEENYKGIKITSIAYRDNPDPPIKIRDDDGLVFKFNASGAPKPNQNHADTDAIKDGYVSISFLNYDLTSSSQNHLGELSFFKNV
tara:strand:+ start:4577 stop:5323 length:747 start_codon:yes stop_codon:yes gene_type:complete